MVTPEVTTAVPSYSSEFPRSPADDEFAERLAKLIFELDIADQTLIKATGYSEGTLRAYRTGRRKPRRGDPRTQVLADALGVTKAWLLRGIEPKEPPCPSSEHDSPT